MFSHRNIDHDNRLNIFTPYSAIKERQKYNEELAKIEPYTAKIIPEIDDDEIKNFEREMKEVGNANRALYIDIANDAKHARDTLQDYFAQTVKLGQVASVSGYNEFMKGKMSEILSTDEGMQKVIDKSNEFAILTNQAKKNFENVNKELEQSKERLSGLQEQLNGLGDMDDEGDGASWIEALTDEINSETDNVENLEDRLSQTRETLNLYNQNQLEYNNLVNSSNSVLANYLRTVGYGNATIEGFNRFQRQQQAELVRTRIRTIALNTAMSTLGMIAIQAVIAGVVALINHYKNLRESNIKTAEEFQNTSKATQDQIDKIKQLQKVIEDEKSTNNELYDARSNLLEIQKELIDTYGEQAKNIDLVNGKLDEEIAKLDEVERKQAASAFHEMSQESYEHDKRALNKRHTGVGGGAADRYGLAISKALYYDKELEAPVKKLIEKMLDIGYRYAGETDSSYGYSLSGVTNEEAIDKINELMSYIETNIPTSSELYDLRDDLSNDLKGINSESYQEKKSNVEAYALQSILSSEDYRPLYKGLQAAAADYDEAIKAGDKELEQSSIDRIEELKNKIEELDIDDKYISEQFDDVLTTVQSELNKRSLKVKIETIYNEGKRNELSYIDYFKRTLNGYSDLDVNNIPLTNSTEEEKEAYSTLQTLADQYKLSIEDVISILVDLGVLHSRDAEAAKYTTTNYASMLEEVDKLTEGLDKFDSAQEKIISGSALTADELNELIKLYPELVSSVERTSKGYTVGAEELAEARAKYVKAQKESIKSDITDSERQLKNIQYELATNQAIVDQLTEKAKQGTLTAEEKRQLNNAKDIVEERLEDEKDTTTQLEQQKLLLEQIISPLEDYASMFDSVADKAKNITDKIAQMKANQAKTGTLSPSDILDFINEVPDWQNYIDLNDGQATFKDVSDEAFKEQIKETSGYNALFKDLNDKIKERDELQKKIDSFSVGSPGDAKILSDMNWELGLLNDTIDISTEELEELGKVLDRYFGTNEKISALTYLENDLAKLNHRKSLGMSDDEYSKEYYDITSQYYNDIQAAANEGDTDALSKLWEIDEQRYQNNIDGLQRNFDDAKLIIDNAREDLQISALEYQKQFAALNEQYYAPGTMLGNTEDGKKQYEANLREIEKLAGDAFSDITSRIQSSIDFGKIIDPSVIDDIKEVFEGQELPDAVAQSIQKGIETGVWDATDLAAMAPYLSEALLGNSEQLTGTLQDALEQQKSYVTAAFEYEKEQLDNQLEAGLISSDDFIDEYTKLWEKYYKDKKEFAKEDLQTQKDILEAYKSEIQKQIDGLDAMSELQTQPYQDEIDALNDVQDEYDKMMDKRIKALNKEKEKLEEQNKEREKANDIQDKYLAMQKASVKKYIVLTNHGWEAQADSEEYAQAKQEYEDAKQESVTDAIEKQIDALEKEKEARDESIQTEIEEREKQIKQIETPINNLTRVLTALLAQQYNLDSDFIAQLLTSADGTTALEALNKKMTFSQSQASAAGVDVPDDTLTTSDAQKMVDGLAKENNRTAEEAAKNIGLNLNSSNSTTAETTKSSNTSAPQSDEVTKLIAEWNAFYAELQKVPSNYGEKGHEGNVDINHRTSVMHDAEGNYGTIYGSTLTYSDLADLFEQYLVSQEKQGKIISEDIWAISESLWQKADQHPDGAFNVSPFKPDGKSVVDLNSETYEDDLYNYLISQLAKGIKLENMDIFMGGDYATIGEADAAAQKAHEDSAELYKKGAEILTQLLLQGYDINQLQGAAYDGEAIKTNTQATEALTEEMKKSNDNAEKQNADSKTDDNKTKDNTVGGYNLVADPKTGKLTKKPVTINGEPVEGLGHKVHAVTKAEHDKNKADYQKALESGTFTGSFADYMRQQRARKKGIVPITEAISGEAKVVAQAIQAFTGSTDIPINSNVKTNQLIEPADIVQVNTQPAFNCTINIEGNADQKTISAIENKLDERFIEYTDALNKSITLAYNKQKGKR